MIKLSIGNVSFSPCCRCSCGRYVIFNRPVKSLETAINMSTILLSEPNLDVDLNFDDLDITTEEIDFDEIDEDLARFQKDATVKDALSRGVDLRQYSRQIDVDLQEVEISSIADYLAETDCVASVFQQITECDEVLEGMQKLLHGFQAELGGISDEIKHLQDQSLEMNVKMRNRKTVKNALGGYIEDVVLPDTVIVGICEGRVNESFLEYLLTLDAKSSRVKSASALRAEVTSISTNESASQKQTGPWDVSVPEEEKHEMNRTDSSIPEDLNLDMRVADTHAAQEIVPILDLLRIKAVSRVREFLLEHILSLKRPNTNVQMVQQNTLLKFQYFMTFLSSHAPDYHAEVIATYIDVMSKLVFSTFKNYQDALLKQKTDVIGKRSLIVIQVNVDSHL